MFSLLLLALAVAPPAPLPGNVLQGKVATKAQGAPGLLNINDGIFLREGEAWDSTAAGRLENAQAFVQWDLGAESEIRCLALQADNNEPYVIEGSLDGENWFRVWTADFIEGAGLRTRYGAAETKARHLKLSASGGDGAYSVAEVAVFPVCPTPWPPRIERMSGQPVYPSARLVIALFVLSVVLAMSIAKPGAPPVARLAWVGTVGVGFYLFSWLVDPTFDAWVELGVAAVAIAVLVLWGPVNAALEKNKKAEGGTPPQAPPPAA